MKKKVHEIQKKLFPAFSGTVFSYGNSKLPKNIMIVNLTSQKNCPSKQLGLCKIADVCYARRTEYCFPAVLPKNLAVEKWLHDPNTTKEDVIKLLETYIDNAPKSHPIKYIRLDENGDFGSQDEVKLWSEIAKHIYNTRGITIHTYTHRSDLDFTGVNFIVNGSVAGIKGAIREYRMLSKTDFDSLPSKLGPDKFRCNCDCSKCSVCMNDKFKGIVYECQH